MSSHAVFSVRTALAVAFSVAASGCWRGAPQPLPEGDPGQPDIVLISIDTLRADHLQTYGYERLTSPWFDELAAEGTRFDFARSASPWTLPSHTTMLSGQLPKTHMVVEDKHVLPDSTPVLPELLQQAGYATGGFVATLYVSRKFNFDRGFDRFSDFDINSERQNLRGEVLAKDVVDDALHWWAEQPAGKPVFLFLHSYDVHYEYDPPGDYGTIFDRSPRKGDPKYKNYHYFKRNKITEKQFVHQRAQYDEAIRYVDDQFKRISDAAEKAGRKVRFIITSDHGEEFGERGSWGHAHTLYAEQLHIPLIISGDGVPKGAVAGAVGTQDIMPTIAAWVDGIPPLGAETGGLLDGIDLADSMKGAPLPARGFASETTRFKTNRLGFYSDGLRLEWDLKKDRVEMFDPHADPKEATDLAKQRPEDVEKLQRALALDLGTPWKVLQAGKVETKGRILHDGKRKTVLHAQRGDEFLVLPYDARVSMTVDGVTFGSWKAVGGERPGAGCPLEYVGGGGATGSVSMDGGNLALLEQLGYITEDEGVDDAPVGAPCGE